MTTKFPTFTIYMKVGIEGIDHEVAESIEIGWDPTLTDEANASLMAAKAQIIQLKMQMGMGALMQKLPEFLAKKAIEQGIDLNDLL